MGAFALGVIGVSIVATSFISGIFGMAGGLVLLGILLIWLDVAPAMVLFGTIQMGANGWRAFLWRHLVMWPIVGRYLIGATAAFVVMRLISFVPGKATVYLALGSIAFLANLLPSSLKLDISRPTGPYVCGFFIMTLQLIAGAAGHILDLFYHRANYDRRQVVATKAVSQTAGHIFRVAYFGTFASAWDSGIPWWGYAIAVAPALIGTTLAARVLERISDHDFRRWSRWIVYAVSTVYLLRGLKLILAG